MTQEFVTLPREVVEQALDAFVKLQADDAIGLASWDFAEAGNACFALRAALDHPQNHVPDAGNMVPTGWKLAPVEPTHEIISAMLESEAQDDEGKFPTLFDLLDFSGANKALMVVAAAYRAMLDAAPQPPTVKDSLTVEQPQSDQPAMTPIAQRKLDSLLTDGYTISGYSIYHEQKHQHGFVTGAGLVGWWKPDGVEYPQPLGEQEPVCVFFPRNTPQHSKDWAIDPEFLHRVLHSIDPDTPYEFTPSPEHIESTLLALEAIPSSIYTHPQPKRDASGKPDECFDRLKAAHNIK